MGSSCACAVGPGMMLAVGKLSHGNGTKAEVNKGVWRHLLAAPGNWGFTHWELVCLR